MRQSRRLQKIVAGMVALSFCFFSVVIAPVQAAMVGTPQLLQAQVNHQERETVRLFLERRDVGNYLKAMGVNPHEAQARVDSLTDQEVRMLVDRIDQMPAGGDGLGFVVAVAFVAFVTLVITDIIGVTDVFTFIKKQ